MEKKYHHISVYCSPKQLEEWKRISKKAGMSLSDWIKSKLDNSF